LLPRDSENAVSWLISSYIRIPACPLSMCSNAEQHADRSPSPS
jgi:hypothetical protein